MDFLGIPNQSTYRKPTVVHNLICRIQNLFPDTCSLCDESYTVDVDDIPILECALCGQSAHTPCIRALLGLDTDTLITMDDVLKTINPFGIPGLHFFCQECGVSTVPSPESGKLNRPRARTLTNTHDETETETASQSQAPSARGTTSTNTLSIICDEHVHDPAPQTQDSNAILIPSAPDVEVNQPCSESDTPTLKKHKTITPSKPKSTCPFYIKGQCRHGISGKTNGGCTKAHPTLCQKLMTYGDKTSRGCSKGKDCDKFHPKMCPASLTHRECLNETCTLYHVKGTRRQPLKPQSDFNSTNVPHRATSRNSGYRAPNGGNMPPQSSDSDSQHTNQIPTAFLEMLQSWRQELMTSIDQRIMEINQKMGPPRASPLPAAVPHAALTYFPTSQLIHPGQGAQHPIPRLY